MGGGGELTKFVCGYLSCDPQLSRVFLGALPPIFKVSIRDDPSGEWLENSIRYSVDNVDASRPGCGAVLAKYLKFCSSKRCDGISQICLRDKRDGWRVCGTLKSGKRWPCFIASPPILGRLLHSRKRSGLPAPCWQRGFAGISRKRLLRISRIGGFSLGRRCSRPRAAAWHQPNSALDRELSGREESVVRWRKSMSRDAMALPEARAARPATGISRCSLPYRPAQAIMQPSAFCAS